MSSMPVPTTHASRRLSDRGSGPVNLRVAWQRGDRVDIPDDSPVPDHDEARYDARADVVIFRREQSLTTCYGLRPDHISTIQGVATALAVDRQYGTGYSDRIDPAQLEMMD